MQLEQKDEPELLDVRDHNQTKHSTLYLRSTPWISAWFLSSHSISTEILRLTWGTHTRIHQTQRPLLSAAAASAWQEGWGRPGGPASARRGSAAHTATKASWGSASSKSTLGATRGRNRSAASSAAGASPNSATSSDTRWSTAGRSPTSARCAGSASPSARASSPIRKQHTDFTERYFTSYKKHSLCFYERNLTWGRRYSILITFFHFLSYIFVFKTRGFIKL